ncbi:MAG: DNA-processing protein DprA, partial [Selenomonadaceae bacterium]|nr:DNA-processing protein DprA [Selenomonadaceae bacterium]
TRKKFCHLTAKNLQEEFFVVLYGAGGAFVEKYYMAAMGGADGLGNKSIENLVKFFGSAKAAWFAEAGDLFKTNVRKNALGAFIEFRIKNPNAPENLVGYCERQKINLCSIFEEDYPPILKEINSPPMFFYYRGKLQPHAQRIGIVGSRHNTTYGQNVALELGEELAAVGLTVVSGAAKGIDSFAHRGALKTGRTVAVLGCGINYIFPRENKKLFEQIAENGVVLSEFPPQLPPSPTTFPPRNRIIAGLCKGVIVVEADFKSGALITSTYAGDYGRDVFAVPGQVYAKMSRGCNELIRDGATLIKNAQDVLDEYNIKSPYKVESEPTLFDDAPPIKDKISIERKETKPEPKVALEGVEAEIFNAIPLDRFITDEEILMQVEDVTVNDLPSIMLKLEMKNYVVEELGRYKRKGGG